MTEFDPANYRSLVVYIAAVDAAVGSLKHIYTAYQVVKALRLLDEPAHIDDMSESEAATVVVDNHEQWAFYVGDDGWSTVQHTPTEEDEHDCTDVDGAVNGLPATADPHDVAAKIVAHVRAPDPQP